MVVLAIFHELCYYSLDILVLTVRPRWVARFAIESYPEMITPDNQEEKV